MAAMPEFNQILSQMLASQQNKQGIHQQIGNLLAQPEEEDTGPGPYEDIMRNAFTPPEGEDQVQEIAGSWSNFGESVRNDPVFREMIFTLGAALSRGGDIGQNLSDGLLAMQAIKNKHREDQKTAIKEKRTNRIQAAQGLIQGRQLDVDTRDKKEDKKLRRLDALLKLEDSSSGDLMNVANLMFNKKKLDIDAANAGNDAAMQQKRLKLLDLEIENAEAKGYFPISPGDSPVFLLTKQMANEAIKAEKKVSPTEALSMAMGVVQNNPTLQSFGQGSDAQAKAWNQRFGKIFAAANESANSVLNANKTPQELQNQLRSTLASAVALTNEQFAGTMQGLSPTGASESKPDKKADLTAAEINFIESKGVTVVSQIAGIVTLKYKNGQTKSGTVESLRNDLKRQAKEE